MQRNQSSILFFQLLGFQHAQSLRYPLFCFFLLIYIIILSGNFLIMMLVLLSKKLRSPMYFFLSHLSLCDVFCTTNIIPNMLHILLCEWCSQESQMNMSKTNQTEAFEFVLLGSMSYDRYLAICNPLHYTSTMGHGVCLKLVGASWLVGLLVTLNTSLMMFSSDFCGPNIIDHFICELGPLLKLSCSNTSMLETLIFVLSIPIIVIPFVFIIASYVCIFLTVLKIPSSTGRKKTFSTCSSHLTSVSTYYGTLTAIYVVPNRGHALSKALYVVYTVVTPLFNPVIYSLRNQEIRKAFEMLLNKIK
ncbi:unnamed protein product [Staurois parvus]|uniref:Olfactory receptor n=1 Tax=Staurois parvus TaxID=386267 RepID=A0ABN9D9H3_9NEOB|nr:unnamed protein product [Staurois parvus]